jgi:hypothetical protein
VTEGLGLLDTGPLVSFLASGLRHHAWAVEQWKRLRPPLLTCEPMLTEAAFLLKREGRDSGPCRWPTPCLVRLSEIHTSAEVLTLDSDSSYLPAPRQQSHTGAHACLKPAVDIGSGEGTRAIPAYRPSQYSHGQVDRDKPLLNAARPAGSNGRSVPSVPVASRVAALYSAAFKPRCPDHSELRRWRIARKRTFPFSYGSGFRRFRFALASLLGAQQRHKIGLGRRFVADAEPRAECFANRGDLLFHFDVCPVL